MKIAPINFAFALSFFNFASTQAGRVLLALGALRLGANPFAVGALAATFSAFPMAFAWVAGRLADRFGSRWLLMAGAVGSSCGLLVPFLVPTLPALYVAAAMLGLGFSFYTVSVQNLVGILGKPQEHAKQFSNFSLVGATTNFVGPLVAGFSIDYAGHAVACLYLAALSLIAIVLLLVWGHLLPGGNRAAVGGTGTLKSLADREVLRMLATSGLVQLGTDLFQFYLPIYGYAKGLSASAIGAALAAFAGASFVVRLFLARLVKHVSPENLLAWSAAESVPSSR